MASTFNSRVPCTYDDCKRFFNSDADMKRHKTTDPDHEYCSRCDQDFQSEEHLLIHKIKSNKHIVCPICATEFRSEGGRDTHIRQNHRSEQNITCYGCKGKFRSASGLMRHIEDDECPVITQSRLLQEQFKKLMIKEALQYGGISHPADVDPIDEGVKINPTEDENREAMANQPRPGESDPTSSVKAIFALKHWPQLGKSERKAESTVNDLMTFSEINKDQENGGWKGKGKAPSVVGSDLSYAPPPSSAALEVERLDAGQTLRIMDRGWEASRFFNSFSSCYVCPCGRQFTTREEFEVHVLAKSNSNKRVQCPSCLRIFKTTAALIAHCESATTRCDINDGEKYGQIIDEMSGGIIQTAGYNEDGTQRYEAGKLELTKTTTVGTDLRKTTW